MAKRGRSSADVDLEDPDTPFADPSWVAQRLRTDASRLTLHVKGVKQEAARQIVLLRRLMSLVKIITSLNEINIAAVWDNVVDLIRRSEIEDSITVRRSAPVTH